MNPKSYTNQPLRWAQYALEPLTKWEWYGHCCSPVPQGWGSGEGLPDEVAEIGPHVIHADGDANRVWKNGCGMDGHG